MLFPVRYSGRHLPVSVQDRPGGVFAQVCANRKPDKCLAGPVRNLKPWFQTGAVSSGSTSTDTDSLLAPEPSITPSIGVTSA